MLPKITFFALFFLFVFLLTPLLHFRRERGNWISYFICLIIGTLLCGIIIVFLIPFDSYSLISLDTILLLLDLALFLIWRFRYISLSNELRVISFSPVSAFVPASIALFAAILYIPFGTEYLDGFRDPGVYMVTASHISRYGGINFDDWMLNLLNEILGDSLIIGYPGIFSEHELGLSDSFSALSVQSYFLFPAILALGYDLFGFSAFFTLNAVFGVINSILIFLISRRICGIFWAYLITLALILNPAQLWNVRITVSELLGQTIILVTLYLYQTYSFKRKALVFFGIGAMLGLSGFNRVDSLLYIPAMVLFQISLRFISGRRYAQRKFLFFGFLFVTFLSVFYAIFQSTAYLIVHWQKGHLKYISYFSLFSIFFWFLFEIFTYSKTWKRLNSNSKSIIRKYRSKFTVIFSSIFFVTGLLAYFVRPELGSGLNLSGNSEYLASHSLVIFSWYVPTVLLFLFPFGFAKLLFERSFVYNNLLLCLGIALFVGYLINPSIAPDHFWATRRWVLFSIPFAIVVSSLALKFIGNRNTWLNFVFKFGIGSVAIYQIFVKLILFYNVKMLSGYLSGYIEASKKMPSENAIYFTMDKRIASPLSYIFDRKTYLISDVDMFLERVDRVESLGSRVYLISQDPYPMTKYSEKLKFHSYLNLNGLYPIENIETFPDVLYSKSHNFYLYQYTNNIALDDTGSPKKLFWTPYGSGVYTRQGSFASDGTLVAGKKSGYLMYGPYLNLIEGNYILTIKGRNLDRAKFDITYNDGKFQIPALETTADGNVYSSNFKIPREGSKRIEFRIFVTKNSQAAVLSIELSKF